MYSNIEQKASKLAASAKPGVMKVDGKVYTLVFNHNEWVYNVYEDGFAYINLNTKSIKKAKEMLKDYLSN